MVAPHSTHAGNVEESVAMHRGQNVGVFVI